ncbi:peptide chain release factor N(5)-glutamine methyltransferase [Candidatus Azobacteroides pseudotrichonymphae]|uniref:peptide chain release factor N(5)-glutamine methyltransferase n=1 Tax=Azobacteroides pseudotrichonymphae genomovar. CFP2 TaxID=511995 RepID=B6YQK9_AZOPC|nr:peptide chain release factor N(5)-glutamine methyltransferase [Candidatus Azobacteroides pseudotrichonymphae]BAG83481.1 protein methyltransferase HemK [Candidatus Azobacteroides pseudotrichonymphae genomovar. CFP2]
MSVFRLVKITIIQALQYIQERLHGLYPVEEAYSLSWLVLKFVCQKDKQTLLQNANERLPINKIIHIEIIINDLKRFRPIQYILGETEFYGIQLVVNENVLIPRPETEELVDLIIKKIALHNFSHCTILDIGTGSGCIALALAKYLPDTKIYALDISGKALEVARQNAQMNEMKVIFFQQDIFSPLTQFCPTSFSVIVSNPPYITISEKKNLLPNILHYEPHQALFVPKEFPLIFYDRIADIGKQYLTANGLLFFETHAFFGQTVSSMLQKKGYQNVELFKDISGKDRMVCAKSSTDKIKKGQD